MNLNATRANLRGLRGLLRTRAALPPADQRRAIREAAGVTAEDVARAVGVTKAAVCLWETGVRYPSRAHLAAYVDVLNALREAADGDRRNSSVSIIEVPQLLSFGPAV